MTSPRVRIAVAGVGNCAQAFTACLLLAINGSSNHPSIMSVIKSKAEAKCGFIAIARLKNLLISETIHDLKITYFYSGVPY